MLVVILLTLAKQTMPQVQQLYNVDNSRLFPNGTSCSFYGQKHTVQPEL